MTPIESGGLAAVIRRQVASLSRPAAGQRSAPDRPSDRSGPAGAAGKSDTTTPDLAALVARRVQAIDADDPDRPRKAFRVFLESVLLAEFGGNLVNDAAFHRLVDDVQAQMGADRDLARKVSDAAAQMLAGALGRR